VTAGRAPTATHEDTAVGKVYDSRLVRRLWRFVVPHQKWIWISLALLLILSACQLALPFIIKLAIDKNLTQKTTQGLGLLAAGYIGVTIVEFIARHWQMYLVDLAGQNSLYDLRIAVFKHMQQLPARFFDKTPIGRLVGRVTTDIESLQEVFSSGVVTIVGDFVFLIATVGLLVALNWKLTLVTMGVVPVLLVVTMFVRIRVRGAYAIMRANISRLNAYLHEQISGMTIVQMFTRQGLSRDGFQTINKLVRDAQLQTVQWESILSAVMEMMGSFTIALILWYGGGLAAKTADGSNVFGLTLGTLFAFVELMRRFFQPLNELSLKYTVMQNAMTASERIFNLLDVNDRIPEPEHPADVGEVQGHIEFRNVIFGYHENEPVLRNVSFRVKAGERVAIVGATGAGKTTILKLLTRMYDIQQGRILLDGVDIRDYALADLRKRVGIVPQDVFLFEGDILTNIHLGKSDVTEEEAMNAANRLHLDEFVTRFPNGYREPVRERGKNLSAGEKQLIAFARVLAFAPPVIVLDEATSNVDSHTEEVLQEAVHTLMGGRTSFVIAHRLSTIRDVDRILVMHKGELVEDGSHEELIAKRGVYWRLYQLQYKDQEVAPSPSARVAS